MTISLLTSYISLIVIRKESNVQSCQQSYAKPKIKLQKNLVMPEGADKKLSISREQSCLDWRGTLEC